MSCYLCGNQKLQIVKTFDKPDKYEQFAGLEHIRRYWMRCECGFYQQFHSYNPSALDPVYTDGYRNKDFRGESIKDVFRRIDGLSPSESENYYRWMWFSKHIGEKGKVLDIGSGFGVWPYELKRQGWEVTCIEPNTESSGFINSELGIICFNGFFDDSIGVVSDVGSLVHVLEHIPEPVLFLEDVKRCLVPNGRLFIEVPDAEEFNYLPDDHDEFNSCHLWFFNTATLFKLLDLVGFNVTDMHRVYHKARNLTRLMVICASR